MNPALGTLFGLSYTLLMSEKALVVSLGSEAEAQVQRTALQWAHTLCDRCGVSIRTHGLQQVDWNQPLIVASNHQSLFDVPCLLAALDRPFGFLSKKELFRVPVFGQAIRKLGCVAIDRKAPASAKESLAFAAERIRQGTSLVVFPEGTRSPDGRLLPFKKGAFYLVQQAGVPLVPVAIVGTHQILSKSGVLVRPGIVDVHIGEPLWCEDDSAEARARLSQKLRASILSMMGQVES